MGSIISIIPDKFEKGGVCKWQLSLPPSPEFKMSDATNDVCYICLESETKRNRFHAMGCACQGSQKIHKECYTLLVRNQGTNVCSVCKETMVEICPHSGNEIVYKAVNDGIMAKYTINVAKKKDGSYYEIDRESGDVRKMIEFSNGVLNGEINSWHADGSIHIQGSWLNGKRHGEWYEFDEDYFKGYTLVIYFQGMLVEYYKYNYSQEIVDYEKYDLPHMTDMAAEIDKALWNDVSVFTEVP